MISQKKVLHVHQILNFQLVSYDEDVSAAEKKLNCSFDFYVSK